MKAISIISLNPTFSGTVVTDDLRANNTVGSKTIQFYSALQVTVNGSLAVTGTLAWDTVTSKTAANPAVVNDGLTVNNTLAVGTSSSRLANEVTVESNFFVGGTLLVDTFDASLVSEISIKDNGVVGLTTTNENLTV